MKGKELSIVMNSRGELEISNLQRLTDRKYKADSPLLSEVASYILMVLCCFVDIAFFQSLFVRISYDTPLMIWLETAGLAFAADVVAVYTGILAKRIKQGLSDDRFNLCLLLIVPIFALLINAALRIATISLATVDGTIDASVIGLTIIGIVTPVFTTVGNFAISFLSYDPLAKKAKREEREIEDIRDVRRRLKALCADYEEDSGCYERLVEMDTERFEIAKGEAMSDALILCDYVKVKLMEYLHDPTASNLLCEPKFEDILRRLRNEMEALTKF